MPCSHIPASRSKCSNVTLSQFHRAMCVKVKIVSHAHFTSIWSRYFSFIWWFFFIQSVWLQLQFFQAISCDMSWWYQFNRSRTCHRIPSSPRNRLPPLCAMRKHKIKINWAAEHEIAQNSIELPVYLHNTNTRNHILDRKLSCATHERLSAKKKNICAPNEFINRRQCFVYLMLVLLVLLILLLSVCVHRFWFISLDSQFQQQTCLIFGTMLWHRAAPKEWTRNE